ncbi:hypothetical protein RRG08_001056 [Elysia crispata]|uniref:Uncharacterized protein n=1 Tax=Elysia crispata TaxID=231223 RepID=A0AAE1E6R6_9GAST|nr:hypothetical protein RRG08_001056 [Elysia crispata]
MSDCYDYPPYTKGRINTGKGGEEKKGGKKRKGKKDEGCNQKDSKQCIMDDGRLRAQTREHHEITSLNLQQRIREVNRTKELQLKDKVLILTQI